MMVPTVPWLHFRKSRIVSCTQCPAYMAGHDGNVGNSRYTWLREAPSLASASVTVCDGFWKCPDEGISDDRLVGCD